MFVGWKLLRETTTRTLYVRRFSFAPREGERRFTLQIGRPGGNCGVRHTPHRRGKGRGDGGEGWGEARIYLCSRIVVPGVQTQLHNRSCMALGTISKACASRQVRGVSSVFRALEPLSKGSCYFPFFLSFVKIPRAVTAEFASFLTPHTDAGSLVPLPPSSPRPPSLVCVLSLRVGSVHYRCL